MFNDHSACHNVLDVLASKKALNKSLQQRNLTDFQKMLRVGQNIIRLKANMRLYENYIKGRSSAERVLLAKSLARLLEKTLQVSQDKVTSNQRKLFHQMQDVKQKLVQVGREPEMKPEPEPVEPGFEEQPADHENGNSDDEYFEAAEGPATQRHDFALQNTKSRKARDTVALANYIFNHLPAQYIRLLQNNRFIIEFPGMHGEPTESETQFLSLIDSWRTKRNIKVETKAQHDLLRLIEREFSNEQKRHVATNIVSPLLKQFIQR